MEIKNICDFRAAMRHGKYAWPGGYPCYFITSDGEALSFEAAKSNRRYILESIANGCNDGWRIIGVDINWEDGNLFCAHNGKQIESAYGESHA